MKVVVLKDEKNLLELKIEGERHSFPALLKSRLLLDKDVVFVSYSLDHPNDYFCKFILKTKSKSAKKALEEAVKSVEDDFEEFSAKLKKAFK